MKKIIIYLIFSLIGSQLNAQIVDFDKIVPPTPEAAHLQSEIKVPVDNSTGIPNISIPLFTIKTNNISVPVYLSYHASGIKVGQLSSCVGLGWGLNAGGGVVRSIRGHSDDEGWLLNDYTNHFAQALMAAGTLGANEYMMDDYDFTQDDYSYNFQGYGGSFFFDSTKTIRLVENDNINLNYFRLLHKFEGKDISGNSFYFDSTETSYSSSFPSNNPSNTALRGGVSAWKLTKIKYQSIDSVQFDYAKYSIVYDDLGADVYDIKGPFLNCVPGAPGCQTCGDDFPTQLYHMVSERHFDNMLIKKIKSVNEIASFYYSDDSNAIVWKRKLDSIIITSTHGGDLIKRIILKYSRFSNEQIRLDALRIYNLNGSSFEETRFSYYGSDYIDIPGIGAKSKDLFGYFNNKTNQYLIVTNDPAYTLSQADRTINSETIAFGTLKSITYPMGGYTDFVYEPNQIDSSRFGPGIRIKGQWDYNAVDSIPNITLYKYFGYHGETVQYPYSMLGITQDVTYHRKFFSSDEPANYHIPLGVVPLGYFYDSVIVKKIGPVDNLVTNFKYTGFVVYNGYKSLLREKVIYKNLDGTLKIVNKERIEYDHIINQANETPLFGIMRPSLVLTTGYIDYPGTIFTCQRVTPGFYYMYTYNENIINKKKVLDISYSDNDSLTQETRYYYNNPVRNQPIRIVKINSKDSTINILKYPPEMVANGLDPTHIYQYMWNANFYAPIIQSNILNGQSVLQKSTETTYDFLGSMYAPIYYKEGVLGKPLELKKQINLYKSGVVSDYQVYDMKNCFLWDDTTNFPIAKVQNTTSANVAYTSFETSSNGNWNFITGTVINGNSVTGKKSFQMTGSNSIVKFLVTPQDMTVTYWSNSGSFFVNGISGVVLKSANGWTCYEHKLLNVSTITITGTGIMDELRLYPTISSIATFTYDLGGNITATNDVSNQINYFNYDGFGRLIGIKDNKNSILKKYEYEITETGNGSSNPYYNNEIFSYYIKQGCPTGYAGTSVKYVVPYALYSSNISQTHADELAARDCYNLGQLYANAFGTCIEDHNSPSCPSPSKRIINGVCTRGLILYTQSVYDPSSGQYSCVYHYEFPDGYHSEDLLKLSSTPCL